MDHNNRREATRVPCQFPVRLEAEQTKLVLAQLVDVSRTGLRLRVPGTALGVHRLASLVQVARRVSQVLGETFIGELHYEHLGPLIRKQLRVVRVAKQDWEHADVEIGCLVCEGHLTDLEATLLGVHLPPVGSSHDPNDTAHAATPLPEALTAYIYGSRPGSDPRVNEPIVARTGALTRGMAMLTVEEGGEHLQRMDVTSVAVALDDAYGQEVTLRFADGSEDLWVGPAEIKEIDVADEQPGAVKLGVAFGRELRAEELLRLGLPSPA